MKAQQAQVKGGWNRLEDSGAEVAGPTMPATALMAILDTIEVPVVVVRCDGKIECFNKPAADVLGLLNSHIGRQSRDVPVFAGLRRLGQHCNEVITGGVETRVDFCDGERWFVVRISPYAKSEGGVAGAVLTFTNVTAFRASIDHAVYERECTKVILNTVANPLVVLSAEGRIQSCNRAFYAMFGVSRDEAQGIPIYELGHGAFESDSLRKQLEKVLAGTPTFQPVEVEHVFTSKGQRTLIVDAHPLCFPGHPERRVLLTFQDITERKVAETAKDLRSEEELRRSERQFKTIFDEAGVGISLIDLGAGGAIRNNRALQTMLGCSEQDLARFETYARLTYAADRETDALRFREICEGKRDSLRIEKHFVLEDGRSIWANAVFTLLRNDNGRPQYIITIYEDITERKQALEKLQANQDLLDLAQKSAGAMAFDWWIQEEINQWSPEQEALFGLAPGTFDGKYQTWKRMMYAPDWPMVVEAIKHAHATGKVIAEYRVVWPDGSLHWLSTNGRMFFDDEGKPLRMVGFTSDVTRRKLVEEELRRSEAFLAEGQHLARMGNFSWRVAPEEIMWSEQLYRIFGFEVGTPVTLERIATRVHPDDMAMFYDMIDRAERGASDFEYEHRLLMPDNSIKCLHLIAHCSRDERDGMEYIGAVQDVTQRRLSEEALARARSELSRVARITSLGVLTASIAHEVNQPLAGIVTNAGTCLRMLCADPPNIEGARETARRTIRDGNRASDVVTRLRTLYSKKELSLETTDLNEIAREVTALSLSDLQRNRVVLRYELADALPTVMADRIQLQQVILNLLRNASDAMSTVDDRPRELLIRTDWDENGKIRLSVRDTGVGIDSDSADKLFEAFYTTKPDGMGIGLSISRSIIDAHNGRMWATANDDGSGVTFCFSIPSRRENSSGDSARLGRTEAA